jgi:hypothetical protein
LKLRSTLPRQVHPQPGSPAISPPSGEFIAPNKKPAEAGYFSSKPFQHPVGSIQAMVIILDR